MREVALVTSVIAKGLACVDEFAGYFVVVEVTNSSSYTACANFYVLNAGFTPCGESVLAWIHTMIPLVVSLMCLMNLLLGSLVAAV